MIQRLPFPLVWQFSAVNIHTLKRSSSNKIFETQRHPYLYQDKTNEYIKNRLCEHTMKLKSGGTVYGSLLLPYALLFLSVLFSKNTWAFCAMQP